MVFATQTQFDNTGLVCMHVIRSYLCAYGTGIELSSTCIIFGTCKFQIISIVSSQWVPHSQYGAYMSVICAGGKQWVTNALTG